MISFINFFKRNSLVKNIQFRLIPMYESFQHIANSNVFEMDRMRCIFHLNCHAWM